MNRTELKTDIDLRIEGLSLKRGQRENTRIRIVEMPDGSWVEVPLIVLCGAQPGPVFYVGAAVHGDEINGVEILLRFAREVDLQELRGTVLLVPVQNPMAFQVQHRYFVGHVFKSPMDQGADPWTAFPGDANGNIASLLCHTLYHQLMQHADYLIDIHTPTTGGRYAPFAFLPPPRCSVVGECEKLAKVFGVDFILATDSGMYVSDQGPHVVMAEQGSLAMGIELGEGGRLEVEEVERGIRGLHNVFREVGMLPGSTESFGRQIVITSMREVRARRAGLLHRHVELNEQVDVGQRLATITNVFGEDVEEIQAPVAGPVVRITTFPIVSTGEGIIRLGVPR